MTISSAQLDYSITSSDTYTIDVSSLTSSSVDTITLSGPYTNGTGYSGLAIGGAGNVYTISGAGSGGLTGITAQDISTFNWNLNEEFVHCLPDLNRVKKMCEEYPSLKIAYEKFVTTYKLVRDDYDTPEDQRPKP
jgi:hypothetical protein